MAEPRHYTRSSASTSHFRNFVFGVEDSLVSTVGLLSGITIAGLTGAQVFATGLVLIFVEAFSMAVGSFLSERSAEEFKHGAEPSLRTPMADAAVMFVSYFVSGFIPLFPYLAFRVGIAFGVSIIASLIALFALGAIGGRLSHLRVVRNGFVMLTIGGAAILMGVIVGRFAHAE